MALFVSCTEEHNGQEKRTMKHINQVTVRKAQILGSNCDINNPPSIVNGLQSGNGSAACLGSLVQQLISGEKNKGNAE